MMKDEEWNDEVNVYEKKNFLGDVCSSDLHENNLYIATKKSFCCFIEGEENVYVKIYAIMVVKTHFNVEKHEKFWMLL